MKKSALRRKPVQAAIAVGLAAAIALAGTFAWYSFNQSKVNAFHELVTPDTNLHDDFAGGPNKDIYVENSGSAPIYVRVRLTEFLQTDNRGSLVEGHLRDDDKAKWWAPHNGVNPADDTSALAQCKLVTPDQTAAAWGSDTFHDYYTWTLGGTEGGNANGQIYYKPATVEQKGEYGPDGELLREPVVVSDPLTGTSEKLDAHLDYTDQVNALMGTGKTEAEAMEALGLKKTLTAKVVSMKDWLNGTNGVTKLQMGDFWVLDEADGWCYWAGPLQGGEATGLLLDRVDRTDKTFDSNAEYCINAWLQAVDETDLGRFEMEGNGGISDNAKKLFQLATGKTAVAEDGAMYTNGGNGVYTLTTNADGSAVENAKPFVALGVNAEGAPLGVNAPAESRIEIGQRVTVTELTWDGAAYTNYDALKGTPNNNWYNLTKSTITNNTVDGGKQIYELTGTQKGQDGNLYLLLAPVVSDGAETPTYSASTENAIYVGSVVKDAAVTAAETPAASSPYHQGYPGSGPFGILYAGSDGRLGTGDDLRLNPNLTVGDKFFYHLGNGVYIQVAETGSTTPIKTNEADAGVTYFFAGKTITSADSSGTVESLFPLKLMDGAKFDVTFGTDSTVNSVTAYTVSDSGKYTMTAPVKGIDGNLYLYLGDTKAGYLAVGSDNYLGNAGDTRRWAGRFGIGGTDDATTPPEHFQEPFLAGKTAADLEAGDTITVDRQNWYVLKVDEYGNRLMMRTELVVTSGMSESGYAASNMATAMKNYYNNSMPTLKPYVVDAVAPVETGTYTADRNETGALSSALATQNNPTMFALSQSEWLTYNVPAGAGYGSGAVLRTRSRATSGSSVVFRFSASHTASVATLPNSQNCGTIGAAWFRFSDADEIATASAAKLEAWKNMPAVGSTVTFGNYPQNQAAATPLQPIEWKVLTTSGTKALLLSTKSLYSGQVHGGTVPNYTQWKGSIAETYLNSTFMTTAFTADEQAKLVTTTVKTAGMDDAQDKVFIPSVEELQTYAGNNAAPHTTYAIANSLENSGWKNWYWLRTLGNGSGQISLMQGTTISGQGNGYRRIGIRPMIWVDYGLAATP